jgi:hypothetical protein
MPFNKSNEKNPPKNKIGNRFLSSIWIRVEHATGGIKRYDILKIKTG